MITAHYGITFWSGAPFPFDQWESQESALIAMRRCSRTYKADLQLLDHHTQRVVVRYNRKGEEVPVEDDGQLYQEAMKFRAEAVKNATKYL